MRPGRVLEFDKGIIKADVPGLFSSVDKDSLPPIYPFFGQHDGQYSSLDEGDEVWVLFALDNPRQLHWLRKDKVNSIPGSNVEVVVNRSGANGWATLMFSDGTGWIIQNGHAKLVISSDGINLDYGLNRRHIAINGTGIQLGGSSHPAAYGDKLEEVLEMIQTALESIKQAADTNIYTKPIALALNFLPKQIKNKIPEITSPHVSLE